MKDLLLFGTREKYESDSKDLSTPDNPELKKAVQIQTRQFIFRPAIQSQDIAYHQ